MLKLATGESGESMIPFVSIRMAGLMLIWQKNPDIPNVFFRYFGWVTHAKQHPLFEISPSHHDTNNHIEIIDLFRLE